MMAFTITNLIQYYDYIRDHVDCQVWGKVNEGVLDHTPNLISNEIFDQVRDDLRW